MRPGATSLNSNMIRDGHPACRLKPASPAVPAASAKEENKNNNDEKCLGIHDVQPFQCDGFGLGFSTISAFARMHIIWGDAIVPASSRSASSRAGRSFRPTGLMKRNERVADLIEKAGREEAAAAASRDRRRGSGRLAPCFPLQRSGAGHYRAGPARVSADGPHAARDPSPILRSIVAPSATLVAFCDSKMTGCGGIRSQLICDELVWDKAIFLQRLAH